MGYVVLGFTYAVGGALLGIGLYIVLRGGFPAWWMEWMLWPVKQVTPQIARLQGLTVVGLGTSIVAIGFSTWVSQFLGGLLVVCGLGLGVVMLFMRRG